MTTATVPSIKKKDGTAGTPAADIVATAREYEALAAELLTLGFYSLLTEAKDSDA